MAEYSSIRDSFQTCDYYARNVCLRVCKLQSLYLFIKCIIPCIFSMIFNVQFLPLQAFEHLLQRELISLVDSRGHTQSLEFHPVKLLISSHELHLNLKSNRCCPVSCQKENRDISGLRCF